MMKLITDSEIKSRAGAKMKRPTDNEVELLYAYIDGKRHGKELVKELGVTFNALGSKMRSIAYRLVFFARRDGEL